MLASFTYFPVWISADERATCARVCVPRGQRAGACTHQQDMGHDLQDSGTWASAPSFLGWEDCPTPPSTCAAGASPSTCLPPKMLSIVLQTYRRCHIRLADARPIQGCSRCITPMTRWVLRLASSTITTHLSRGVARRSQLPLYARKPVWDSMVPNTRRNSPTDSTT